MRKKIKLFDPVIGKSEFKIVNDVLASHFWASGAGTNLVKKFELGFKKYINSKDCVAVNSGTAALNLALSLFDLQNKEVILPSLTFVSTAHAIILNNAKPIFVDVDPNTLCIDPEQIRKHITKKTAMILPVHFAGIPCDLEKILEICKEHNLSLVEDAAHAAGSLYKNKKIGSHGNAVCFSFHPVKNLAMPNGGLISLNDLKYKIMNKKLLARRWCGIDNRHDVDYDVKELGWNYYMNEISASIGLLQLKKLDKMNSMRKKIAKKYYNEINLDYKMSYDKNCVYHFYWIMVKNRNKFRKKLANSGIETGIHYKPIHKFSMYQKKFKLPHTENAGEFIVTLPTHPNLTNHDLDKIIHTINNAL